MIRFTFFKKREPKRFDYLPRHHDPDKEDLERRIRNAKAELGIADDSGEKIRREINFREQASQNWGYGGDNRKASIAANLRLIAILFALAALFYYIYSRIDGLVEKMI